LNRSHFGIDEEKGEEKRKEKRRERETPLETVIRLRARGDSRGGDCGELGPPHFWIFSLFCFLFCVLCFYYLFVAPKMIVLSDYIQVIARNSGPVSS
jgi:hypothetical protein